MQYDKRAGGCSCNNTRGVEHYIKTMVIVLIQLFHPVNCHILVVEASQTETHEFPCVSIFMVMSFVLVRKNKIYFHRILFIPNLREVYTTVEVHRSRN